MDEAFYIMSIDGGGIRGVFPSHILACISDRLGVNLYEQFGLIAGTSTGSIVAAGVANKIPANNIVDLYRLKGAEIFTRQSSCLPKKIQSAVDSIYNSGNLRAVLEETFGKVKLGEIDKPLILPATDIGHGGVHVFKSAYCKEFTRDIKVSLVEAVLASCSAPTYFNPVKVNEYLLADGGLWANNPSLVAVIDAQRRLGVDINKIKILSLGTGQARTSYGVQQKKKWGLMKGWQGPEFISFMMSLQAQSTHNYLGLLLRPEQIMRLDFESDQPLPLDDVHAIDDLISRADRTFTYNSEKIRGFLS